jgi:hypothetical protein
MRRAGQPEFAMPDVEGSLSGYLHGKFIGIRRA